MNIASKGRKIRGNSWKHGAISAVTHGAYRDMRLIDLRTEEGRELRVIAENTIADKGGADALSSLQLNLIESYAITVWRRRRLGAGLLNYTIQGKPIPANLDADFRRFAELEMKLAAQLGLEREAKELSLDEYVQKRIAARSEATS